LHVLTRMVASFRMPSLLRSVVVAIGLFSAACSSLQSDFRSSVPAPALVSADPVDDYLRLVMENNKIPGAAVAIVRDGKIEKIAAYGFADLESEAKVELSTPFQIASATKVFTATLVMLLVQEGVLDLDAPVSKYLSDAPEAWKLITLRHLAAHASGIHDDPADQTDDAATVQARYEAAKKLPLDAKAGERSEYALTDFVVLTHLLEKVTGKPFEELLTQRVFKPLGFGCTSFEHATQEGPLRLADVIPRRATTYRYAEGLQKRAWYLYPKHAYAAGGAFSCVNDLARWAVAMDQGTLLKPSYQVLASAPLQLHDGRFAGFGVGFAVSTLRGLPFFGHSGGPGLADIVRVPDKKLTVVVLTNQQRLFPALGANIASLYLPPLPALEAPGIADTEPLVAESHRQVVEAMVTGRFDEQAFAPRARETLLPALQQWGVLFGHAFPALRKMVLLSDTRTKDSRKRVYRVIYGKDISLQWVFSLDATGKILDVLYDLE